MPVVSITLCHRIGRPLPCTMGMRSYLGLVLVLPRVWDSPAYADVGVLLNESWIPVSPESPVQATAPFISPASARTRPSNSASAVRTSEVRS